MGTYTKNAAITFITQVFLFIIVLASSVIVARILGPEGKGIYSLAIFFPTLLAAFASLGIGPATVYHVAQERVPLREVFGNNILLSLLLGAGSVIVGLIVVLSVDEVMPGVPQPYLLLALAIIPPSLLTTNLQNIFLGMRRIGAFNLVSISGAILGLIFVTISLLGVQAGVPGVIVANILASLVLIVGLFFWIRRIIDGVSLRPNSTYLKAATTYGIQAHLGTIFMLLNYRAPILLLNTFLNPVAVGFYSIAVGMAERLWLVSHSSSTVLFPRVAAEKDQQARKEFTPIVSRNVLLITAAGAAVLYVISRWVIVVLYSTDFLPSAQPFRILLPGIVALSVSRVLATDISGRGRPILNTYLACMTLAVNVGLNVLWIPKYGVEGTAWATTVSYSTTLFGQLWLYCRLSGNSPAKVLLPQLSDWTLYRRLARSVWETRKRSETQASSDL